MILKPGYDVIIGDEMTSSHPEIGDSHFMNDFSGRGPQQAPGMEREIRKAIALCEHKQINIRQLGYKCSAKNRPFLENAII